MTARFDNNCLLKRFGNIMAVAVDNEDRPGFG